MALPMALGVMLVLSISIFATLEFTGASSRESSLNETRQRAKGFAEAGVNYGASVLAQQLADTSGGFASDLAVTNTTIQGAPVRWWATYQAGSPKTWLVGATATLPNPTGPTASPVPRTVEAQFQWAPTGASSQWHGLYVGNPGTIPLMSNAEASISTDVYVNGSIMMQQGKFLGSSFQVWGSLTLDTSAMDETSIGASDRVSCGSDYRSFKSNFPLPCSRSTHRVATFKTRDGCRFNTSATPAHASCSTTSRMGGPSGKIWLTCPSCTDPAPYPSSTPANSTNYTSSAYNPMTAADAFVLTAPNVPPALADYDLGPGKPCVTPAGAPNFTASSTDIMGGTSYSCVSPDGAGELSWNASTNTLTARGTIYFQGQLELQSGRWGVVAAGSNGEIFVRDKLLLKPGTGLCGIRGTTAPLCDPSWDPLAATNLVSFMVGSDDNEAILQDSFHFQGGLYTDHGGYLNKNNSTFKGPTVFEGPVQLQNHGTIDAWSPASPPSASSGGSMELTLIRGSWRG